jgi:eukaryotic-like serine/threonine-protein kinase
MPSESRIMELLEEVLDSQLTPEEVCAGCPEMLPVLKDRLQRYRSMDAQLEEMFPSSRPVAAKHRPGHILTSLPDIPGYEIKAILGRGGIGIVYEARHLTLRRRVALKMLLSGEYASALELTRFMREARSVAALQHPNIVQVHDVGDFDGRPFYTMELIEGGTLGEKLAGVPQPAREAAALVRVLAQAVDAAHQAGIVHRDLKPANILLNLDGAPKISDFGLARQLDEDLSLTLNGARIGTPSYMSPEQAAATADAALFPVDIYALGAILYEMLTGRPPFRGETAAETQRQVVCEEAVPPSRLNAKVPRDLETICLKALSKLPKRRYATAAAMADDLHRFLRGEPVVARPAGLVERMGMWARRNPAPATAIAAGMLISVGLIGGLIHLDALRVKRFNAVQVDLKEVADLEAWEQWPQAQATLQRALERFDNSGPDSVRTQLERAQHDLDLVQRLNAIHLSREASGNLPLSRDQANRDYAQAFEQAGLAKVFTPLDSAASPIQTSAVHGALVAALDDWSFSATDPAQSLWLLELAQKADGAVHRRADRLRDPVAWASPTALADLARKVSVDGNSISAFLAMAQRLNDLGVDPAAFLERVQKQHPADFWTNLVLGDTLLSRNPFEAGTYYRAALAARPTAAVCYNAVADSLALQSHHEEAIEYYQKALSLNPDYPRALTRIADCYRTIGRLADAIDSYQKSLRLDPNDAWAHVGLAQTLARAGQFDAALYQFNAVPAGDLYDPAIENAFRGMLVRQGRGEDALALWKKQLATGPASFDQWNGYAELCLFLGHDDQYQAACASLLEKFGKRYESRVEEPIARACLLLPSLDLNQKATALANHAVWLDHRHYDYYFAYSMFAKGLSDYRLGRFDGAIAIMSHSAPMVMGPCPNLIEAMALHDKGDQAGAMKKLAQAVTRFDWSRSNADQRDIWIFHILRREAEAKILPSLPAFLAGTWQPTDNNQRLALTGVCQFQGLAAHCFQLYIDAFSADPALANNLDPDLRFRAACAAAIAASGTGQDSNSLSPTQRTAMRASALKWLSDDLDAMTAQLNLGDHDSSDRFEQNLKLWRSTSELAGVRQETALQKLSPDEIDQWNTFWSSVDEKLNLLVNHG